VKKSCLKVEHSFLSKAFIIIQHSTFHSNLFLIAEYNWRRTKPSGWFSEFGAGGGFSRTLLGGTTYKVSEDGRVKKQPLAGYTYFALSLGGGMGYDLSMKRNRPLKVYSRLSLLAMAPYNSFFYLRPTLEFGLISHLSFKRK